MPSIKIKLTSLSVPRDETTVVTADLTGAVLGNSYVVTFYAYGRGNLAKAWGGDQIALDPAGNQVVIAESRGDRFLVSWTTSGVALGKHTLSAWLFDITGTAFQDFVTKVTGGVGRPRVTDKEEIEVTEPLPKPQPVTMRRAEVPPTADQALWTLIRKSASALSFKNYSHFMEVVMCGERDDLGFTDAQAKALRDPVKHRLRLPFPDTDAYRQLKVATEMFVMLNCAVSVDRPGFDRLDAAEAAAETRRHYRAIQPGDIEAYWRQFLDEVETAKGARETLPYLALIRRKLKDVAVMEPDRTKRQRWLQTEETAIECLGILMDKLTHPCLLELIWSYWHEEGMLVQTMNTISMRFQNRRGPTDRDPLALLEIDPLRPLNNFVWGYIQDEQHRLSVARRAYEYDHHYGLTLLGKAVPAVRGADSRSRFLEAFHNLLYLCSVFFKEDDDTTVVADGFPVLNGLKEVHLLLTQGAHNQYGDLPWTARQEMLMQQWMLARPEMREFLPSRVMVDYPEEWMDRVETMKTLQGWTDVSIMHFRDLGVFGEQILLGIRFGAWPSVIEPQQAANWARYWRPEIQGYIHAYRAATGVDMTTRVDATSPAQLLRRRALPARAASPGLSLTTNVRSRTT